MLREILNDSNNVQINMQICSCVKKRLFSIVLRTHLADQSSYIPAVVVEIRSIVAVETLAVVAVVAVVNVEIAAAEQLQDECIPAVYHPHPPPPRLDDGEASESKRVEEREAHRHLAPFCLPDGIDQVEYRLHCQRHPPSVDQNDNL
jgi:hypothetical protein